MRAYARRRPCTRTDVCLVPSPDVAMPRACLVPSPDVSMLHACASYCVFSGSALLPINCHETAVKVGGYILGEFGFLLNSEAGTWAAGLDYGFRS